MFVSVLRGCSNIMMTIFCDFEPLPLRQYSDASHDILTLLSIFQTRSGFLGSSSSNWPVVKKYGARPPPVQNNNEDFGKKRNSWFCYLSLHKYFIHHFYVWWHFSPPLPFVTVFVGLLQPPRNASLILNVPYRDVWYRCVLCHPFLWIRYRLY